jgi:hypothetical protein
MEIEAEILEVPTPERRSKITSSATVGTEALLIPPLVADQFVGLIADQFVDEPPPTQYLLANLNSYF